MNGSLVSCDSFIANTAKAFITKAASCVASAFVALRACLPFTLQHNHAHPLHLGVSVDSVVMSLLYSQNTLTFVPLASKVNQREGKLFMRMPILHLVLESLCSRGSYLKLALKSFTKFLLNTSARHRCNRKTRTTLCD